MAQRNRSARFWLLLIIVLAIVIGIGTALYYGVSWDDVTNLSFDDLSVTVKALICAIVLVLLVWGLL